jgi:hypothetical protein
MVKDVVTEICYWINTFLGKIASLNLVDAAKMLFGGIKNGWEKIGEVAPDIINKGLDTVNAGLDKANEAVQAKPIPTDTNQKFIDQKKTQDNPLIGSAVMDTTALVAGNQLLSTKFDTLIQLNTEQLRIAKAEADKKQPPINLKVLSDGGASAKLEQSRTLVGAGIGM